MTLKQHFRTKEVKNKESNQECCKFIRLSINAPQNVPGICMGTLKSLEEIPDGFKIILTNDSELKVLQFQSTYDGQVINWLKVLRCHF